MHPDDVPDVAYSPSSPNPPINATRHKQRAAALRTACAALIVSGLRSQRQRPPQQASKGIWLRKLVALILTNPRFPHASPCATHRATCKAKYAEQERFHHHELGGIREYERAEDQYTASHRPVRTSPHLCFAINRPNANDRVSECYCTKQHYPKWAGGVGDYAAHPEPRVIQVAAIWKAGSGGAARRSS